MCKVHRCLQRRRRRRHLRQKVSHGWKLICQRGIQRVGNGRGVGKASDWHQCQQESHAAHCKKERNEKAAATYQFDEQPLAVNDELEDALSNARTLARNELAYTVVGVNKSTTFH